MPERTNPRAGRILLDAAGAKATTAVTNQIGSAGAVLSLYRFKALEVQLKVTATGTEAGDTLDVFVDTSLDGGLTWINIIHFPQVIGTTGAKTYVASVSPEAGVGATPVDVSADAAANAVRHILGDQLRARYTTVDAVTTGNLAFAFGVAAYGQP